MRGGNVAVVGGSVAGCAVALAAARGGAERVTVFERAGSALRERGVGITLHRERYAEFEAAGYLDDAVPWVRLERRLWTVREGATELGRAVGVAQFPFRAYAWGALWRGLRQRLPPWVAYRAGSTVTAVEAVGEGGEDGAMLVFADGSRERFDLVIGADGYRSVVRDTLFPGLRPEYAGYLGWRGASAAPRDGPRDIAWTDARTVVFPGGHCVMYRIPGNAGGYRVNWVLYSSPPEHLTARLDLREPTSLPPGQLTAELGEFARDLVARHFPPYWAQCVRRTPQEQVSVQPIYDLEVPRYARGRLLLAGDAATVARPHTGGGAVKAIQDALILESAWRKGSCWQEVLAAYDADRTAVGASMVALGRRMGRAQVVETPDWASLGPAEFDAWWQRQTGAPDAQSGFGGHALGRP